MKGGWKEGRLKKKKTENELNMERKRERKKERKGIEQTDRKKETKYFNNVAKLTKCVCVCVCVCACACVRVCV